MAAEGRRILIYPEGHLAAPGERFRYRTGVYHMARDFDLPVVPVATNLGCFWQQTDKQKTAGTATIEFLPPLPQGLSKTEFMARMEDVIETRTNQLIAQARGEPVKPSVLVEWNGRKNVDSPRRSRLIGRSSVMRLRWASRRPWPIRALLSAHFGLPHAHAPAIAV